MKINAEFELEANLKTLEFIYGKDVFGPVTEKRHLSDIRKSLSDPHAKGPDIVYSVAMDVGKKKDRKDLMERNLLYGAMIFEKGMVGKKPVRSQGHVHAISPSCHASTCEVYEIWSGAAYIYMQEHDTDDPGRCFAAYAQKGDVVIVPPGWAHTTINAHIDEPMLFGAWCIRDYGFVYTGIRNHQGIAYFPIVDEAHHVQFISNKRYDLNKLEIVNTRVYRDFGLRKNIPIYTQYEENKDLFTFATEPSVCNDLWKNYRP